MAVIDYSGNFVLDPYQRGWRADGGPGSGNFGHAGRPGEVGGSAASDTPATSYFKAEVGKLDTKSSRYGT